jgi:hypothetical protein
LKSDACILTYGVGTPFLSILVLSETVLVGSDAQNCITEIGKLYYTVLDSITIYSLQKHLKQAL